MSGQDAKPPPRVSIQFGAPASSSNVINKRARPAHGKRHRAQALDHDSPSDDDDDSDGHGEKHNPRGDLITSYGPSGISTDDQRRWRNDEDRSARGQDAKRRTHGAADDAPSYRMPAPDSKKASGAAEDASDSQDGPPKWGLTINMKGTGNARDKRKDLRPRADVSDSDDVSQSDGDKPKNIDDEALEALVGAKSRNKKARNDSNAADREPELDDYRAVPIDDFGATLLKGFGWDGKLRGKVKEVNKHANLTGLGAKDVKGAEDLGAWDQKTSKDSRPARLEDYQREDRKKRQRLDDQHRDSYKREREREREQERKQGRGR